MVVDGERGTWAWPSVRVLGEVLVYVCMQVAAMYTGWGTVVFTLSLFYLLARNLGTRQAHTLSAYSVFNDHAYTLPGTFTAHQFDTHLRTGLLTHAPLPPLGREHESHESHE